MTSPFFLFVLFVCFNVTGQPNISAQEDQAEKPLVAVYTLANKHFADGEYPQALAHAKQLCQRKPDEFRFHFLRGEVSFANGDMKESVAAFDKVIRLQPRMEPQLWQRGLALYYAKRFQEGVEQFETHQTVNSQDVENAVWHMLCAARTSNVENARKSIINVRLDRRIPMAQVFELFAGEMNVADVMKAAEETSPSSPLGSERHNLQLYYAHLYIGLYQEMVGENEAAKASMRQAIKVNPLDKNNFMGRVAPVHAKLRGWVGKKVTPSQKANSSDANDSDETKKGQSETTPQVEKKPNAKIDK